MVPFTKDSIEQSIGARLEHVVAQCPDRLAVEFGSERLTYRQLNQQADELARVVLSRCHREKRFVVTLLPQGITLLRTILAILKAGKTYVPIDPSFPPQWISQVLAELDAGLIVVDGSSGSIAQQVCAGRCDRMQVEQAGGAVRNGSPPMKVSPDDTAYIYFTSGSTGRPKGVVDCHRNVLHNIMRYTNSLHLSPDDRLSLLQPPSFSGAVSSMFGALLNGAAVVPLDLRHYPSAQLANWVNSRSITVYHSVPSIFRLIASGENFFPTVRLVRLEGDMMSLRDVDRFRKHFGPDCVLVNGLGVPECGLVRQYFITKQTEVRGPIVPIGYPVENMDVVLLDDQNQPVGRDEVGEIGVRSRYLAMGYWGRPELNAARFVQDSPDSDMRLYRTGDLGRLQGDGCLELLGRVGPQLKVRGNFIDLAVIQQSLLEVDGVSDAVVVTRPTMDEEREVVGYYVGMGTSPVNPQSLRQHVAQRLPPWMMPTWLISLEKLPTTAYGKLDRDALPEPESLADSARCPYVAAHTALQQAIAGVWLEVLGINRVGMFDDFFDLGGDSLKAMQILIRLRERHGIELTMSQFFEHSTIHSAAELWQRSDGQQDHSQPR